MEINTESLQSYFLLIKDQWISTSSQFPYFLTEIPIEQKKRNENYITEKEKMLNFYLYKVNRKFNIRKKHYIKKVSQLFQDMVNEEKIIGIRRALSEDNLNIRRKEVCSFFTKARTFSPELSFADLGQAVRNYLVFIMFKEMNHVDTSFSLPCFGYSMLYPFTDNYIDNLARSSEEKIAYNQLIRQKIKGLPVSAKSLHDTKTCQLLDFIESEYKRTESNTIYTLLLMMLEAQEMSMSQQGKNTLTQEERLHISVYKGGVSVLIDGFFANNNLRKEELWFYLSFGFFLQLADDLSDIEIDSQSGHQTLFTLNTSCEYTEATINKLFSFVYHIFRTYPSLNEDFKSFLLTNCYYLILYGVTVSSKYVTPEYIDHIMKYLPVDYNFFANKIKNFSSTSNLLDSTYFSLIDEMLKV